MVLDETVDGDVEDALLLNAAHWHERTPPELNWDESEAALVEDIVGRSRMRG